MQKGSSFDPLNSQDLGETISKLPRGLPATKFYISITTSATAVGSDSGNLLSNKLLVPSATFLAIELPLNETLDPILEAKLAPDIGILYRLICKQSTSALIKPEVINTEKFINKQKTSIFNIYSSTENSFQLIIRKSVISNSTDDLFKKPLLSKPNTNCTQSYIAAISPHAFRPLPAVYINSTNHLITERIVIYYQKILIQLQLLLLKMTGENGQINDSAAQSYRTISANLSAAEKKMFLIIVIPLIMLSSICIFLYLCIRSYMCYRAQTHVLVPTSAF